MADLFGLLELPAPAPAEGAALTDPALDVLLDFMRAVLNADLGDAWAARAPTDAEPVAYVFNHAPASESFNMDETPALYAWRSDDAGGTHRYAQDLFADEGGFTVIWVPPPLPQEDARFIEAARNGIKKSLKAAFGQGRHPAWVVSGDDYYEPEIYGSVLLRQARLGKCRLGAFRTHALPIASQDGSYRKTFDALLFTLDAVEFFQRDLSAEVPLDHAEGTVSLAFPGAREDALDALPYHLEPELSAADPSTGPEEGGTTVVLTGAQLSAAGPDGEDSEIVVLFGTAAELAAGAAAAASPDGVELLSETELSVVSPPHAPGLVSVSVVLPSGVTKTLADAFTYTDTP